jgi:hypothetical protein
MRAVALLHSFGYEEARRGFGAVAAKDPSWAMAYWGIAMTWYHPIWAPPNSQELAAGTAAARKAAALPAKTERERGYIAAIGIFYRHSYRLNHPVRARTYGDAMEQLSKQFPDDHEAQIFYALSLLGTAPPGDTSFANQEKAAAILNSLLPLEPQHPGIAHYIIHSFDYPQLAADALPAARAYSRIAPDSPHALHMPSHIFTPLGLWPDSIASNLASADAGRRLVAQRHPGAASMDTLHALDYLEYAYLQLCAGGDSRTLCLGTARLEGRGATRAALGRPGLGELSVRPGDHLLRPGDRRVSRRRARSLLITDCFTALLAHTHPANSTVRS